MKTTNRNIDGGKPLGWGRTSLNYVHRKLFEHIAPNEFDILHYGAIAELKRR